MATKQELLAAYKGFNGASEYPYKPLLGIVWECKGFLLGDGYSKSIKLVAADPNQQEQLDELTNLIKLNQHLVTVYSDVFVTGQGFLNVFNPDNPVVIRDINITEVKFLPENPLAVAYLKEKRDIYNPINKDYEEVEVEHRLVAPAIDEIAAISGELTYTYEYKIGSAAPTATSFNYIPIVRFVAELDEYECISPIDSLLPYQREYNDIRIRLHENNRHHKPQLVSLGTSAPEFIGRTNLVRPLGGEAGSSLRTEIINTDATILHLPISKLASDAGISPDIKYIQPQDNQALERQLDLCIQEMYNASGAMVLDIQNARGSSSSSSLRILYEKLRRYTFNRASYLSSSLKLLMLYLGSDIPYSLALPDMLPRDIAEDELEIQMVENKLISRLTSLMRRGFTEAQAQVELTRMEAEKTLSVQYSAALNDVPTDNNSNTTSSINSNTNG